MCALFVDRQSKSCNNNPRKTQTHPGRSSIPIKDFYTDTIEDKTQQWVTTDMEILLIKGPQLSYHARCLILRNHKALGHLERNERQASHCYHLLDFIDFQHPSLGQHLTYRLCKVQMLHQQNKDFFPNLWTVITQSRNCSNSRVHRTKKEHDTRQGLHGLLVSKQDPVDDLDNGEDGDS